jgi:hypothetical protein
MDSTEQTVNVEGSQNQVIIVGNDFVKPENYFQQKTDFFKPKLEQYKSPPFVSPENISELTSVLYSQRILILGGSPEVDKDELARHIAWYLASCIEQEKNNELGCLEIMEWYHNSDRQSLLIGIQEAREPTIFILPQVSPGDIGYDPLRLQMEARRNHHFVVISTEKVYSSWKISDGGIPPVYWIELSPDTLYSTTKLTDALIEQLIASMENLPVSLSEIELRPETLLGEKITIRQAASQLRTPKNIAFFVGLLSQNKKPLTDTNINEWLNTSRDSSRVFAQWFLSSLRPHEQTAALGLALFEGMFDDQFFAALEVVTQEVWRSRDPLIIFPDYGDLENLASFYDFIETQDGGFKVNSKNASQRKALFILLWEKHRRKLLAALPVISRLATNSVKSRDTNQTLYGSQIRRSTIRNTIGDALSDLGLVSPLAVEDSLLQLAADQDFAVQVIAAKSMARWREFDRDKDLFEMLQRWRTEARFAHKIKTFIEGRDTVQSGSSPEEYIRATVAVVTGQAALYDPPNQLSTELVESFKGLAKDSSELVRDRFRSYTLPTIISQHLNQIGKDLRDIVRYVDLIQAVGASLARAYRVIPNDVVLFLTGWYRECMRNRPTQVNKNITHRDAMLATVILTWGQINYSEGNQILKADEVFKRLRMMLETEHQPFIRSAIVKAITLQTLNYFDMIEEQLRRLLPEVTPAEREEIVNDLKEIYLKQRADLMGGDYKMSLGEKTYAVWSDTSKRPITNVEQVLYRWLEIEGNIAARQIATQAFTEFEIAFGQHERDFITTKKNDEEQKKKQIRPETALSQTQLARSIRQASFAQRAVAYLVTLNDITLRSIINDVLPEASVQFRDHRSETDFVVAKWKTAPPQIVNEAAKRLHTAVRLVQNASVLTIVSIIMLLCGSCVVCNLAYSVINSLKR